MTDPIAQFIGQAKKIGLTPEERTKVLGAIRTAITDPAVRIQGDQRLQESMEQPSVTSFVTSAKGIELSAQERVALRVALVERMQQPYAAPSLHSWLSWLNLAKGMPALGAFVLLIGTGASASFAAENSVPGDLLYPVKIHVNEVLMERLAVSSEDQARLQAKRAIRRLKEAESLAAAKRLDAESTATLQQAFGTHARNVRRSIALMAAAQDASTASTLGNEFQASLEAHASVIDRLANDAPQREVLRELASDVREAHKETERSRVTLEIALSAMPNDERQATALQTVDAAKERLEESRSAVAAVPQNETHQQFALADNLIAQAEEKIGEGAYADGFGLVRDGIRNAEEARLVTELQLAPVQVVAVALPPQEYNERMELLPNPEGEATDSAAVQALPTVALEANPVQQDDAPKQSDTEQVRKRLVELKHDVDAQRGVLSPEAQAEAELKLSGAENTLDAADTFAKKEQMDEARQYTDAAIATLDYVQTFAGKKQEHDGSAPVTTIAAPMAMMKAEGQPLASTSPASGAMEYLADRPVLSPEYAPARKHIEESEKLLKQSESVLDASTLQDARNILLKARNTLVEAQAAFDAKDDVKSRELFDKVTDLTKKANKTLAEAARKAILEHEAAPASASSSAEATLQPAQADESPASTR